MDSNNEIVSLRQIVRQARICVINKTTREVKKLRGNHGNEKQLEKNKHKADKLLREVFALKRVKDDEISRFGIINFENLQALLHDSQTDDRTRVMVKVVCYKSLNLRIAQVRQKFPNYNEYISWKRKKHSVSKKGNVVTDLQKESSKQVHTSKNEETIRVNKKIRKDVDIFIPVTGVPSKKNKTVNEKCGKPLGEKESNKEQEVDKVNAIERSEIHDRDVQPENCQVSKAVTKVISKEATVKRFVEILQETETEERKGCSEGIENQQVSNKPPEFPREVDDFFLNANNAPTFSSIPRSFEQENAENVFNVNCEAFKSDRISRKGKLCDEKIGRAKRNKSINDTTETSVTYWKESGNKGERKRKERRSMKGTNVAENESLHPSWVAKRKQQDILKQGFQGKKIKFDED